MPRTHEWLARGFVTVLTAYQTIELFLPRWLRPDAYDGDLAQHVWWTARFADPGRFPGDFIADFFSLPLFAPLGHQAVYRVGVRLAEPQSIAEALGFLLGPLLVFLCWRAGRAAARGRLAGAVLGACLGVRIMGYIDPGLPRGYALPVLALGIVGLLEGRLWLVGLSGLAAALFYPPIAVNLGLTAAVVLGVEMARRRRLPAGWRPLAALGAAAAGVVLSVYAQPLPEDVGPKVTAAEARAMPEFHAGGRASFYQESRVESYLGRGRGGYGMRLALSASIAVAVALSSVYFRRVVPLCAWALLGTGMLAHALAHVLLFALHLPSRYMLYTVPVFLVVWLAAVGSEAVQRLAARIPALARPAPVVAAGLVFLAVDGAASLGSARAYAERAVFRQKEAALAFLETLPKDTLVVAHPDDANGIPLRTGLSVLASYEVALPYYLGYYRRLDERLEATLRAIYARDWKTVDALHARYGVDVVAAFEGSFKPERRRLPEPFATRLADVVGAPREAYVLHDPPADRVLFTRGRWRVVRVGPPRPGYEVAAEARSPSTKSPAAAGAR